MGFMNFKYRVINTIAVAVSCFSLSGCDTDIVADLFVTDILSDENVPFSASMAVEVASCRGNSLDKAKEDVLSLFSVSSDAKVISCENKNLNSMLLVSFTGEVASTDSDHDFVIFRHENEDGDTHISAVTKPIFLQRATSLARANFRSIDSEEISIYIKINNDSKAAKTFWLSQGWVNGVPKQGFSFSLAQRKNATVKMTNLIAEMIYSEQENADGDHPELFVMLAEEKSREE